MNVGTLFAIEGKTALVTGGLRCWHHRQLIDLRQARSLAHFPKHQNAVCQNGPVMQR